MSEPRQSPTRFSRRTLAGGAAWSAPVIAIGAAAPALAVSAAEQCWTGNLTGTVNWSWQRSTAVVTVDGVKWRRFDYVATITNTWANSTLTDLFYVVPWVWTGPLLNAEAGPWTAATWNDSTGMWTSNRSDSAGRRIYLAAYQTSTPLTLQSYLPYTTMPFFPMSTTSTGNTGSVVATHDADDQVYVVPVGPLAFGETTTISFSMLVEYTTTTSLMESAFWGSLMGTGCVPE